MLFLNQIKLLIGICFKRFVSVFKSKDTNEDINTKEMLEHQEKSTKMPNQPTFVKCTTIESVINRYGVITNGKWPKELEFCSILKIPEDISFNWINSATGKPTTKIYCNKDMQGPLLGALTKLKERGLLNELQSFDGCYNIRDVRGKPGSLSCHSYALAIDINAKTNPLGEVPTLSPEFITCFLEAGFDWGGVFDRMDGMHFSFAYEGNN